MKLGLRKERALWIGGLVAAAAAAVGVTILVEKKASASPSGGGGASPGGSPISIPSTLKSGERYAGTVTMPASQSANFPAQFTVAGMQAQAEKVEPGEFKVVDVSSSTSGGIFSAKVVFDVIGPADYTTPVVPASAQAQFSQLGATLTITDQGAGPANHAAPPGALYHV